MAKFTFHYQWKMSLQSSVESLWPYVSDTDQFRAAISFPAATYIMEEAPDGLLRRIGHIHYYGFPIEWEEDPFEWIRLKDIVDTQHYRVGPLRYVKVHITLESRSEGGTDLTYDVLASPANLLGYPAIPIQIGMIQRMRTERAFRQMDNYALANVSHPFQTQHTPVNSTGRARLDDLANQLRAAGHAAPLVNRLIDLVRTAPDHELTQMRPYAFADLWDTPRNDTLELFLQATKLGLLDMFWNMLCPQCRGAMNPLHSLHDVSHAEHCPSCNIDYEVDFARSVEATFQVNPAIKTVTREMYCIGSPQNTPHILMQQSLAPGETRTIKLKLDAKRYRWRVPKLALRDATPRTIDNINTALSGQAFTEVHNQTTVNAISVTINNADLVPKPDAVGAGMVKINLINASNDPQVILLEQTDWSDQASTAAEVTSLQSFRDLFSSEALRPGESISVERLTVLFTDLKGSTILYQTVGDAPAFRRVMDHFTLLRDGVARHQGALVKTIGDAIMAVFADPLHAVEAAVDILHKIDKYNDENPDARLVLKMGIHQGTCIAVTLNERLDYFGSVVNLAARLESQSQGGDVVISGAVATDPAVEDLVKQPQVNVDSFEATLKGFTESFFLSRLTLGDEFRQTANKLVQGVATS